MPPSYNNNNNEPVTKVRRMVMATLSTGLRSRQLVLPFSNMCSTHCCLCSFRLFSSKLSYRETKTHRQTHVQVCKRQYVHACVKCLKKQSKRWDNNFGSTHDNEPSTILIYIVVYCKFQLCAARVGSVVAHHSTHVPSYC